MYEYQNKEELSNNSINNNEEKVVTKSYVILTLLAGILTLVPITSLIFNAMYPTIEVNDYIFIGSFYGVKLIGILIYYLALPKMSKVKNIWSIVAIVFLILSAYIYLQPTEPGHEGIDYIGEAVAIGLAINICMYIYYSIFFVIFFNYAEIFIFKKKVIISIIVGVVLIALLFVIYKAIDHYMSIEKVTDNIPTVSDFEKELRTRHLYVNNNLLFGIDDKEDNIHKIDFYNNSTDKYPAYIYYGYKTLNIGKETDSTDEYLNWVIYYMNGNLYASIAKYYESSFPNSIILYGEVLSENKTIYIYNHEKNYYDLVRSESECIDDTEGLSYRDEDMYISIDFLEKDMDCLWPRKVRVVERIDARVLNDDAINLKDSNTY